MAKLDITAFQKMLNEQSQRQVVLRSKTKGAFGGATKDERMIRRITRRLSK